MALTVNTNIASLTAQRNLTGSQTSLSTSLERLSSGLRINSAKDDAAGLAISERFSAQIRGLNQGVRNANDGISLAQTAEGALKEVTSNLQRIRELAVQSANATNSQSDRDSLQVEVGQLIAEIERVATTTTFNGINLLDGTFTSKNFQVGPNAADTVAITSIASAKTADIGSSFSLTLAGASAVSGTALTATELRINNADVGASVADGVSTDGATGSALAIANAINAVSSQSGVTATASTTVNGGVFAAGLGGGVGAKQVVINDVFIEWSGAATDEGELANAIAAINAQSGTTGVVASRNITNGQVDLTAADGRNIEIAVVAGNTGMADLGLSAGTNEGTISYSSTSELGIQFTTQAYTATTDQTAVTEATDATLAKIGQTNQATYNSTVVASGSSGMSGLSVASVTGATAALATVDTALDSINSSRATLGAYQNRFESVVANLQTTSENLSASRSRIVDADFASETANLTKAQILQQSGIAMLAQANALPQNVLALLQ